EAEEAGAAALEALGVVVHAVDRDVQRGVWEAVERAVPLTGASRIACDQRGEVEPLPTGVGQALDQFAADRAAHFRSRGVELLRARRHLDYFPRGADLQVNRDIGSAS